ncbi:hypothetical protein P154DRAFT_617186 [Amniculicola lignicola CBS 123094]|uniref:Uncharacterized protein n=1 Tax=Amniculicola lignicola CBS 123094 TaxID=1392246 RepID=A0A6A5X1Q0_9PLEO|nr:hypothetical protein P154DRAFT_617186 [Amniculicola lignicola CBS 123094]
MGQPTGSACTRDLRPVCGRRCGVLIRPWQPNGFARFQKSPSAVFDDALDDADSPGRPGSPPSTARRRNGRRLQQSASSMIQQLRLQPRPCPRPRLCAPAGRPDANEHDEHDAPNTPPPPGCPSLAPLCVGQRPDSIAAGCAFYASLRKSTKPPLQREWSPLMKRRRSAIIDFERNQHACCYSLLGATGVHNTERDADYLFFRDTNSRPASVVRHRLWKSGLQAMALRAFTTWLLDRHRPISSPFSTP